MSKEIKDFGKKVEGAGKQLTAMITIPILLTGALTVFLGPLGLGIGVLLSVAIVVGTIKQNKDKKQKEELAS